jgi:hypothetical protein
MKRLLCIISVAMIGLLSTAYAAPPAPITLEPPQAALERSLEWKTLAVVPSQSTQVTAPDYTPSEFLLSTLIAVAFAVGMTVMHRQARPKLERQLAQMRVWTPREHPPYPTPTN